MTLTRSVARQCRLLRAPPALPGALQRRSFASSELADEPVQHGASAGGRQHDAVFRSSRRVDLTAYRKHQRLQAGLERRRENGQRHKRLLELSYFLTPQLQDSDVVPVHSATLIPASATAATPDDFLDKIQPISELAPLSKHNLVVFLATPSFAPWLLDERVFLEKALAKLYAGMPALPKPLPNVHAICAVVDRLPEPQPSGAAAAEDFTQRALNPPLAETGYEGVAYVVLPSRAEVSKQPAVQGEFGCLDFLAHTHTYSSGRHYDRLRVPLANTVFQTGQPSTLVKTVWAWSEDQCKLEMRTKRQPKTSVVNLSVEDPKPASSPLIQSHLHREAPALSIPLLPLTVPRQVDGYMGNIIRGVVGANHVKITASTELEQVVPRFFKSRGEPAQATSAWALVIPKSKVKSVTEETTRLISASLGADPAGLSSEDYQLWQQKGFESLWQSQPPQWNTMIQDALLRGARLHKVLSGGGGWGKKAGLLSLDPVPVGAPAWEAHRKDDTQDDFDSVDEFSTALKPVVEDGDFIQFFTPAVPAQREEDGAFKRLKDAEQTAAQPWSWEFGVIPSTVDSIPGGSWQHTGNAKDMAVFRGCFGALTEGGLTLMRVKSIDRRTGFAEENLFSTTVDVPFSRWSAIRLSPKKGIETGRISDSNKEAKALMEGAPVSTKNAGTS